MDKTSKRRRWRPKTEMNETNSLKVDEEDRIGARPTLGVQSIDGKIDPNEGPPEISKSTKRKSKGMNRKKSLEDGKFGSLLINESNDIGFNDTNAKEIQSAEAKKKTKSSSRSKKYTTRKNETTWHDAPTRAISSHSIENKNKEGIDLVAVEDDKETQESNLVDDRKMKKPSRRKSRSKGKKDTGNEADNAANIPTLEVESTTTSNANEVQQKQMEKSNVSRNRSKNVVYEPYREMKDVEIGLKNGTFLSGEIRVNKQNRYEGYVSIDGLDRDIYIDGIESQNRSVDGDLVVVEILPQKSWKSSSAKQELAKVAICSTDFSTDLAALWNPLIKAKQATEPAAKGTIPSHATELQERITQLESKLIKTKIQITAKVVHILKRKNEVYLGVMRVSKGKHALFQANDKRIPRDIRVPSSQLPPEYHKDPKKFAASMLCMCRLGAWGVEYKSPNGSFVEAIGHVAEIESDILALLAANSLRDHLNPFSKEIYQSLPSSEWTIPDTELKQRRDLRDWTIFSIDPSTARDLDDAMSIRSLDNGIYEIGVHIADVSYFVTEGSAIDLEARQRCTSVYLVNQVLPMLPRVLCEQLCSLNASVDRLAFSVLWQMHEDGSMVVDGPIWYGKTVIRSCCQMDYGTAQQILDGDTAFEWPCAPTGNHSKETIARCVVDLGKIARARRRARFATGAIQLHRTKLSFELDKQGKPIGMREYPIRESNHVVEEYMLLANYLVAQKLLQHGQAVLRHHLPPDSSKWENAWSMVEKLGIAAITENQTMQEWLSMVEERHEIYLLNLVRHFLTKPMQTAEYLIANQLDEFHRHYALNLPYYTHFTSPIRRYADVYVHRLLHAALTSTSSSVHVDPLVVEQCNRQKQNSKLAQQNCDKVFLVRYIENIGELATIGIVVGIGQRSLTLLLYSFGFEQRLNAMDLQATFKYNDLDQSIHITTSEMKFSLEFGQAVHVKLTVSTSVPLELKFTLLGLSTCPKG